MRDTDRIVSEPHPDVVRAYRADCAEYRPDRALPLVLLAAVLGVLSLIAILLL